MMLLFKPSSKFGKKSKPRPYLSFSESLLMDSIETVETFTRKWLSPEISCSQSSTSCSLSTIFAPENRLEGRRFVEIVNSLQYAIQGVVMVNSESQKLTRARNLVSIAMKLLEKEFYRILKSNRRNLDLESVSFRPSISFHSRKASSSKSEDENLMMDLKMIADCMISSGYENECVKIYKKIRTSVMMEALEKLGFENLSFGKIQKLDWESMEKHIKSWLEATKFVFSNLFDGERNLCDNVFSASSVSISESCFTEITLDSALTLFIFPVSVARCRKTVEKIFLTLDVYQTISKLLPQIEETFSYDSTSAVRLQAADSLKNLGESINSLVAEFESSITKESSKSAIPGGGVHQLTRYVMNFIVFLADYHESLAGVLTESTLPLPEDYFHNVDTSHAGETGGAGGAASAPVPPVTTRIAWLILVLLCKIDTKSRMYTDMALSYLFLANNLHYVISKVRTSNLVSVLGNEWVANHEGKLSQYLEKYEKLSWGEVMASLESETTLEEHQAKERLKRFNEAFREMLKKQSEWLVQDSKLRDDLKDSVTKKLIVAASSFYKTHRVDEWDDIDVFVLENLGNYFSDLYLGTGASCHPPLKTSNSEPSLKSSESGR